MGDDVFKAKMLNPDDEEVGSMETRVEGNKFHSVRFKSEGVFALNNLLFKSLCTRFSQTLRNTRMSILPFVF